MTHANMFSEQGSKISQAAVAAMSAYDGQRNRTMATTPEGINGKAIPKPKAARATVIARSEAIPR